MIKKVISVLGISGFLLFGAGCAEAPAPAVVYHVEPAPYATAPQVVYEQPPGVVPPTSSFTPPAAPPHEAVPQAPPPQEQVLQQPAPPAVQASPPQRFVVQSPPPVVVQAPPIAPVEVVPVAPAPDYTWVHGYWSWNGAWVWVPGRWTYPPHRHAIWVGGSWVHERHGYRWHPGHWR